MWVPKPHEVHLSVLNVVLVYADDILGLPIRPQLGSLVLSFDQDSVSQGILMSFEKEPFKAATLSGLWFLLEYKESKHAGALA